MEHFRHGDVLLTRIDAAPDGQAQPHEGCYPLAFGEVTGHKHLLTVSKPEHMTITKVGQSLYICLMEVGTLTHEEHATIEILPGTYKMDFEREYDYCLEDMRQVID